MISVIITVMLGSAAIMVAVLFRAHVRATVAEERLDERMKREEIARKQAEIIAKNRTEDETIDRLDGGTF